MKTVWNTAIGAVFGLLAAGVLFLISRPPMGAAIVLLPPPTDSPIIVHISGAVVQPGVFAMPSASRLRDLVNAAGGMLPNADPRQVNLAAPLEDGQHILILEIKPTSTPRPSGGAAPSEGQPPPEGTESPQADVIININTASLEELDSLPGIGPAIAQRIIEYRTAHGDFNAIEEIQNVSGIGPATFEKIKERISVGP
jgi:competence protein ComEA